MHLVYLFMLCTTDLDIEAELEGNYIVFSLYVDHINMLKARCCMGISYFFAFFILLFVCFGFHLTRMFVRFISSSGEGLQASSSYDPVPLVPSSIYADVFQCICARPSFTEMILGCCFIRFL